MGLTAMPDEGVILRLIAVISEAAPSESEPTPPDPASVIIGPGVETDEAKMIRNLMRGIWDEMDRRLKAYSPPIDPHYMPTDMILLPLSKAEYAELGKPRPHEIITLTLTFDPQAEPQVDKQE